MTHSQYVIDHVNVTSSKPFAAVKAAFEAQMGPVDEAPYQALAAGGDPATGRARLEALPGSSGFTNFHVYDHGAILRIVGVDRQALTYVVGNSLFAIEMTQHVIEAAVHAPLRIELYVNDEGLTAFDYDVPSSIFARFGDSRVDKIGAKLDSKMAALVEIAFA